MTTESSDRATPESTLAAARAYLRSGLMVVPVPWREKRCVEKNWAELDLTEADLTRHFPPGRPMNVGILLGAPSGGLIDVDLDCREAVAAAPFLLPQTGRVSGRAGNPRSHYWYKVDDPPAKASESFPGSGEKLLELRSTGAQTVAPPSVHPTGEAIDWYAPLGAAARVEIAHLRTAVGRVAAAALLARHWPDPGSRHDAHLALAGALFRAGWAGADVVAFVKAMVAATADEEGRARLQNVVSTAAKAAAGGRTTGWTRLKRLLVDDGEGVVRRVTELLGLPSRRTPAAPVAAYRPFPVHLLPDPLARYVEACAAAVPCDPGYIAPHVLAACAGMVGLTRVVQLKAGKRGWVEPPILWALVVADSGTCKSPAFDHAIDPVQDIEADLHAEAEAADAAHKEAVRAWKRGGEDGAPPAPPAARRARVQDTTLEALLLILRDNGKVLVARDELRGWVESFRRYRGRGGGTDLSQWLELFRGKAAGMDRKTGDHRRVQVDRAGVSVCGTIQRKIMARAFDPEAFDSGCVARVLLAMPPKQPKSQSDAEVPDELADGYARLLRALYGLGPDTAGGRPRPHAIALAPAARARWKRFVNEWGLKTFEAAGEAAAAFSKLEGYAARFALLFHVVRHVAAGTSDLVPLGLDDLERGIALAGWFAREAERVYAVLAAPDDPLRDLAEWVARQPGRACTPKQLQQARGTKYPRAESAEAALQELVDAGYGERVDRPAGPQGGRPTWQVRLFDPPADDSDETDETDPPAGGGPADRGSDETPGGGGRPSHAGPENGVSSVSSESSSDGAASAVISPGMDTGPEVSSETPAGFVETPRHILVADLDGLAAVAAAVVQAPLIGLDSETTGLDPRADRVRLLSLAVDGPGGPTAYLIDCVAVDPSPLWGPLAGRPVVGHHLAFDLALLARLGFVPGAVLDTLLQSQLLYAHAHRAGVAPGGHTLKECAERELGVALEKDLQASDWAGPLTDAQLAYAAADAAILLPLARTLRAKLTTAGLDRAAAIEMAALPAVVWMAGAGVPFDRACWESLAVTAADDARRARAALEAAAPAAPGGLYATGGWNWDSPKQVKEALALAGCRVESTRDAVLAGLDHPVAGLLRDYRDARKRETTYGAAWLQHVAPDGRVYPRWVQVGANSGRMACAGPNMQNLPRGEYRRCFAAPPGRILVKADYSQIELRIAAKVSGDAALLDAYRRGDDLHTLTARQVLGVTDVTKDDRQLAKALNFGLLYGMGARAFAAYARATYGLALTESQAAEYREAFFRAYPGLRRWHRAVRAGAVDTRTLAGRRVSGVTRFTEKLNLPVQGTGADGLKVALGLLWERRAECPDAVPVLAVHDEIVVECDDGQAARAADWLKRCLADAMAPLIGPVPVEVEVSLGRTWAGG